MKQVVIQSMGDKIVLDPKLTLKERQRLGAMIIGTRLCVIASPFIVGLIEEIYGHQDRLALYHELFHQKTKDYNQHYALRPYQEEDANFMTSRLSAANLSEPRTGKTPTTFSVINACGLRTIIVVPPALLDLAWKNKASNWIDWPVHTLFKEVIKKNGEISKKAMAKEERIQLYADFFSMVDYDKSILLVSRDTWKNDYVDYFDRFTPKAPFCLVVDEAHYLRNYYSATKGTKQTKGLLALRKFATRAYAMTGTPSANHPSDVWGILHFLDPQFFKSYYDFIAYFWGIDRRFGWKPKQSYRSWQKEMELISLVENMSVMHKQKEVMPWLPPVIKEVVEVEMVGAQRDAYFDYFVNLRHKEDFVPDILSHIGKCRVVSNAWMEKDKIYSGKLDWIREYLAENDDEKVLILSFYSNKTIPIFKEGLKEYHPRVLTGANKDQVAEFIAAQDTNQRVFIANTQVVKEGLTMDKIDTIIFLDRMFNPDDNLQAENRFMPTTKNDLRGKEKQIIDLISRLPLDILSFNDSIKARLSKQLTDRKILDMLNRKESITAYLNNLGKSWIK